MSAGRRVLGWLYRAVKWTLGVVVLLMFAVLALSLLQQHRLEQRVETGMSREAVIQALGEPRLELEELGFCRDGGTWLGDCEAARRSGAVRYLIWKYGIDTYQVIGLDRDGRVVFHDMGDA